MNRIALASILVLGCGGGSKKQPDPPKPETAPDTDSATMPTTENTAAPDKKKEPEPPPAPKAPDTGGYSITNLSKVTWAPLDPSNAAGPQIAVLHGDPKTGGAYFLKLPAGMKSGLHTHTADYHSVVVSGAPKHFLPGGEAKAKPLAAGSHWFQPGGQPHGDECTGKDPCIVFLIQNGAFDFAPAPKAKAEKTPGKYKLTNRSEAKFAPMDPNNKTGPKAAFMFGDPTKKEPIGFWIEVPPGGNSGLHSHSSNYHALILEGQPTHWLAHETGPGEGLEVGTYWFQPGGYEHGDSCKSEKPCRAFVFMENGLDFKPAAKK